MPHVLEPDRSQPVRGHFTGGFDLALERAGIRVAAAVEVDPDCRSVLRRQFPGTAIFNDVTEVTVEQLRAAGFVPGNGVLCAGWPCQGNSVAGRRKGMADPRSGLWRHVVRLLAEARPRWFLGENVPGLLSINGGRDFGAVLRDLDELGYGVAWRVLDAQWFGVPQRRRRVFLAGCLGDPCGPVEVLLEPEGGEGNPATGVAARPGTAGASSDSTGVPRTVGTLGTTGPGGGWRLGADEAAAGQLVTAATLQGGGRRGHRIDAESAAGGHLVAFPVTARESKGPDSNATSGNVIAEAGDAVRRLTPRECERLQGFPDDWTRWSDNGTEQSDSARYRQLGNAVAVPVVAWIASRLAATAGATEEEGAA